MSWQKCDFDLRDPKFVYIDHNYDSLNDPYLHGYFKGRRKRQILAKQGLISTDGKIVCSLKDFNKYRQHVRHTFLMEVYKERREEVWRRCSTVNCFLNISVTYDITI